MTTIAEVRQGLATAAAVTGLSCSPYITDPISAPCGRVYRKPADPRYVFNQSKYEHNFGLVIYAGRMSDRAAEILLDSYCELSGSTSILAKVQDGANWSITVDYAQVVNIGDPQPLVVASDMWAGNPGMSPDAVHYITVEFDIKVVW